jgi:hypothetical protein
MDLTLENLSNQRVQGKAVAGSRRFMRQRRDTAPGEVAPRPGGADMDLSPDRGHDMTRMNDLVRAYEGSTFRGRAVGALGGPGEERRHRGLRRRLPWRPGADGAQEPKTLGRRLYEGVVGAASKILRNRPRGEVATVVTISGRADQPEFSTWKVVGHLFRNAFFKAILPGFEPERSPKAPPAAVAGMTRREVPQQRQ